MDEVRYVVVGHDRTGELRIVEDGWSSESLAAGAFDPGDVLRAFRLANTWIPEGCERGPWQAGIALFDRGPLPEHPNDWTRVEPEWLPPSVTSYPESAPGHAENETCCAPAVEGPRVDWARRADLGALDVRALVRERVPDLEPKHTGTLKRAWNAHPEGSLVVAPTRGLDGPFAVVDLPPE